MCSPKLIRRLARSLLSCQGEGRQRSVVRNQRSAVLLCRISDFDVRRSTFGISAVLAAEGFFVHHVRHLGWIAAVVPFQYVDESLNSATSHAFVGIDRETRDLRTTGEVMKQPTEIGDFGIEQWRIR